MSGTAGEGTVDKAEVELRINSRTLLDMRHKIFESSCHHLYQTVLEATNISKLDIQQFLLKIYRTRVEPKFTFLRWSR